MRTLLGQIGTYFVPIFGQNWIAFCPFKWPIISLIGLKMKKMTKTKPIKC